MICWVREWTFLADPRCAFWSTFLLLLSVVIQERLPLWYSPILCTKEDSYSHCGLFRDGSITPVVRDEKQLVLITIGLWSVHFKHVYMCKQLCGIGAFDDVFRNWLVCSICFRFMQHHLMPRLHIKKRNKQESFSLAGPEDWRAFCLLTLFRWFCLGMCVFPSKLTENGRWSEVLRSLVVGIRIMLNVHNLPFARWVNTRASSLRMVLHGCATNLHANLPFCPHEGVATLGECA